MKKYLLLNLLLALLVIVTAYIRFYPNHVNLPTGCDEFGYLQLSDAMANDLTFEQHTAKPFMRPLISHLKSKGYAYREYAWMVAPHAYHLDSNTEQIINQYPPGVSLLMSFFPKHQRQFYFPGLMFALLFLIGFSVIYFKKNTLIQTEILITLLLLFCVFALTSSPILKELTNVNSVAPTLAFLLAGGMLLVSYPLIGIVLIAFSINFRLANALLIPLLALYYLWTATEGKMKPKLLLKKGLEITVFVFISGGLLYMGYAQQLLGNPFALTYSGIDQRTVDAALFLDNVRFYFSLSQMWLVLNLLLFAGMIWLWKKGQLKGVLFYALAGTLAIVYVYFLLHAAKTPYYPYAPAIIMLGVLFDRLSRMDVWKQKWIRGVKLAAVLAVVLIGTLNYSKFRTSFAQDHSEQVRDLKKCFDAYDLVWGELKTGTIEYATAVPTMRYFWGSDALRAEVMQWLSLRGVKQAIYLSDLDLPEEDVLQFLVTYDIGQRQVVTEKCGKLINLE